VRIPEFELGYFDGYDRKPPARSTDEYMQGYQAGLTIEQPAVFYHRTPSASQILKTGFKDSSGSYGIGGVTLEGVFISDIPLDINEGAKGDDLLRVTVPEHIDLREYELMQPRSPYREWCVPAEVLNTQCTVCPVDTGDDA
jgi:hypothetical protein